jgi:hypothetical protein
MSNEWDYGFYKRLFSEQPDISYEEAVAKSEKYYKFGKITKHDEVYNILVRIDNFEIFGKLEWANKDLKLLERDYPDLLNTRAYHVSKAQLAMKEKKYEEALENWLVVEKTTKKDYEAHPDLGCPHAAYAVSYFMDVEEIVICLTRLKREKEAEGRLDLIKNYYRNQIKWNKKHDPTRVSNSKKNYESFLKEVEKAKRGEPVEL